MKSLERSVRLMMVVTVLLGGIAAGQGRKSYAGFDRNVYPGDAAIKRLRQNFAFTGYWLNSPPGANANSWKGKREVVWNAGLGFLVLWNGRAYKQLGKQPQKLGQQDAEAAVAAARQEGFHPGTVIFLDQEEGGRLLAEQRAYLHAWVDGVTAEGFRAGVYCSGIGFKEGGGATVITAEDIRANAGGRKIKFWVANDACPPSPGCVAGAKVSAADSGLKFVDIWQYAQSPMRPEVAAKCRQTYDASGACRVGGTDVDLNVAGSADPSGGRQDSPQRH